MEEMCSPRLVNMDFFSNLQFVNALFCWLKSRIYFQMDRTGDEARYTQKKHPLRDYCLSFVYTIPVSTHKLYLGTAHALQLVSLLVITEKGGNANGIFGNVHVCMSQ